MVASAGGSGFWCRHAAAFSALETARRLTTLAPFDRPRWETVAMPITRFLQEQTTAFDPDTIELMSAVIRDGS